MERDYKSYNCECGCSVLNPLRDTCWHYEGCLAWRQEFIMDDIGGDGVTCPKGHVLAEVGFYINAVLQCGQCFRDKRSSRSNKGIKRVSPYYVRAVTPQVIKDRLGGMTWKATGEKNGVSLRTVVNIMKRYREENNGQRGTDTVRARTSSMEE